MGNVNRKELLSGKSESPKDPLYVFKLDPETGQLTRFEICNWVKVKVSYYAESYSYLYVAKLGRLTKSKYECSEDNIDEFKNSKVVSFNPDIANAVVIIVDTLTQKRSRALSDYNKWGKILERIESKNYL